MTDFKYGNIWSCGVPFGGGKSDTAAELLKRAYNKLPNEFDQGAYSFSVNQMQTFIDKVCKEQLQKAATAYIRKGTIEAIRTAEKPDGI